MYHASAVTVLFRLSIFITRALDQFIQFIIRSPQLITTYGKPALVSVVGDSVGSDTHSFLSSSTRRAGLSDLDVNRKPPCIVNEFTSWLLDTTAAHARVALRQGS
jgi:hypothetical protein